MNDRSKGRLLMKGKLSLVIFKIIRALVKLFYPEIRIEGEDNLPDGPAIIVGNHCKMNAPIACELYFPGNHYTWTAGEMMQLKEVPSYSYKDFWSHKPGYIKWFFKLLSYFIAPLAVSIFNNALCIGVYHDSRIMRTFRTTVAKLKEGARVIIFPEHDVPHNNIVCEFQDKFVDVARLYHRRTGEEISFVPMYVAPRLRSMYIGKPVRYDSLAKAEEERERITNYLMDEITDIARGLPEHTVIPYPNISRRKYPTNIDIEPLLS